METTRRWSLLVIVLYSAVVFVAGVLAGVLIDGSKIDDLNAKVDFASKLMSSQLAENERLSIANEQMQDAADGKRPTFKQLSADAIQDAVGHVYTLARAESLPNLLHLETNTHVITSDDKIEVVRVSFGKINIEPGAAVAALVALPALARREGIDNFVRYGILEIENSRSLTWSVGKGNITVRKHRSSDAGRTGLYVVDFTPDAN
jgi:hypothetical protein